MRLWLVGKDKLRFDDESEFKFPELWQRALNDKLVNDKFTLPEFLATFDKILGERRESKTATDKFGTSPWEKSNGLKEGKPYANLAELAENELYQFLRCYILGPISLELDSIRIELGKLGIHFALLRSPISRGELKSFDEDLQAYGKLLNRLQATIHACSKHSRPRAG